MKAKDERIDAQDVASGSFNPDIITIQDAQCCFEGAHAHRRKRGRPRKAENIPRRWASLGRRPFSGALREYMDSRRGLIAESTYIENERKLRYLGKVLEELKSKGKLRTTDPRLLKTEDVQVFLQWMRERGLDPETKAKYLHLLSNICAFYRNYTIQQMKRETKTLTKTPKKPIRWLNEVDLEKIQDATKDLKGWTGDVLRFLVAFYPATGLRPSELRLAWAEDIDTENWTFFVRFPKGLGTYGEQRRVSILPQAREATLKYLLTRERRIKSLGLGGVKPLIMNYNGEPYAANRFQVWKQEIERKAGVKFRLKDFRSTFATQTAMIDPNLIPDVSAALGHTNLETTQRYYAQMDRSNAVRRLENAWEKKLGVGTKSTLIPKDKYLYGYA
jgi:integrase